MAKLTPPTQGEIQISSNNWWSNLDGVTFLDYSDELKQKTFPFELIKFSKSDINSIVNLFEGKTTIENVKVIFENILYESISKHKEGFFIKLISRSPKDFLFDENNFGKPKALFTSDEAALAIINSMRCFDDMIYLMNLETSYIVIRPYIPFHPKYEFRVFVKDNKIIAISQYYYESDFKYSDWLKNFIEVEIRGFVNKQLSPNMKINDFVADIVVCNEHCNTTLLETNPFGLSDPCLFSYENMDGSIRFNN